MASAPAGLEVLPDAQFASYRLSVSQIRGLHARILAKVGNNGELTGEWKIVLGSARKSPRCLSWDPAVFGSRSQPL